MPVRMSGTIDAPVGRHPTDRKKMSTKTRRGRRAVTHWEIVERFGKCASLARIRIETGRTHQIRVHLAANGMPVIGDAVYGGRSAGSNMRDPSVRAALQKAGRPMLHAAEITIAHPGDGREMRFKAPLPRDFQDMLEELREIG
jgi:23S rRNA pseudouridine1911/1915/1917 synthase